MKFTKWPHLIESSDPGITAEEIIEGYINEQSMLCDGEIERIKSNIEELTRIQQLIFNTLTDDQQESIVSVLGYERNPNEDN